MPKVKPSKLLYPTYDGSMKLVRFEPKYLESSCTFELDIWDELVGGRRALTLIFSGIAALEFSLDLCNSAVGCNLGGFYEILSDKSKKKLIERNFERKRKSWLMPGDYDYSKDDPHDSLNYRKEVEKLLAGLEDYHLYLLESLGGSYQILARDCTIKEEGGWTLPVEEPANGSFEPDLIPEKELE